MVGKTVTLELKPEQAETLARARQTGTLSLALRSIADINMAENKTRNRSVSEARRKRQRGSLRHPKLDDDTEVTERTSEMKSGGIQPAMRTFLVRALSFSAVAALALSPALTPVVAADSEGHAGRRRRSGEDTFSLARHRQIRDRRYAA